MSSGPGKFIRSTQAWLNRLSKGVLSTLLLSCLLQNSPASAATTTIFGIDLGMHEESIDTGRHILTTLLEQADNETSFGLVLADELVRTAIDPTSAEDLLEALPKLTLSPGDSGNFSTLLERSLAMADEAMARKAQTDTVNLWVISGGEIKLSSETDNTSKKARFQMWASDILLPDIAERYPDFRIITPQQNNPEMIDAVTLYFGQTAQLLLPETKNDVGPLIGSLISENLIIATNSTTADGSSNEVEATTVEDTEFNNQIVVATVISDTNTNKDIQPAVTDTLTTISENASTTTSERPAAEQLPNDIDANRMDSPKPLELAQSSAASDTITPSETTTVSNEWVASNVTIDKVKPVQSISKQSDPLPDVNSSPDADKELADKQQRPAIKPTNNPSTIENEKTLATTVTDNTSQAISDTTLAANADRQTEALKVDPQIATDNSIGKADLEVADLQVIAPTNESSAINKSRITIVIAMLGATSVLTAVLVALYRRKRRTEPSKLPETETANSNPLVATESVHRSANTVESAEQAPADKRASIFEMIDTESETVIAQPTISADAATVVTQTTANAETVVIQSDPESNITQSNNEEVDFSAFDRSIIEKRWAKLEDENPASPDKK